MGHLKTQGIIYLPTKPSIVDGKKKCEPFLSTYLQIDIRALHGEETDFVFLIHHTQQKGIFSVIELIERVLLTLVQNRSDHDKIARCHMREKRYVQRSKYFVEWQ